MLRVFPVLFFAMLLCSVFTGCSSVYLRYEPEHVPEAELKLPFKLYLKEVKADDRIMRSKAVQVGKTPQLQMEAEKLKHSLLVNYPQYFTSDNSGIYPEISILLTMNNQLMESEILSPLTALFLSLPTLGLIPTTQYWKSDWKVILSVADVYTDHNFQMKKKVFMSAGILGAMLQTHRICPEWNGHHEKHIGDNMVWLYPDSKHLHKQIINALNLLDRDELTEYYNTHHTQHTQFLE